MFQKKMPAPLFGISPGLSIIPAKTNLSRGHNNNMIVGLKRHRRRSRRPRRSHLVGRSKVGGRARKRKHRRRRHRTIHQIPTHPSLFT